MIRVYLDWNIYSYIRTGRNEKFIALKELITNNSSSILFLYSPAHLQDLKRSYFSSQKGRIETEKDLKFLGEITSNHCLYYDAIKKTVFPNVLSPLEYFEDIFIENPIDNVFEFENIIDEDEDLGTLWKAYLDLLNSIPTGIDLTELNKIEYLSNVFKETNASNTFGSLMKDIVALYKNPNDFEKAFKNIRTVSGNHLKINPDNSKWGNPFDYLEMIFKKNKMPKGFFDLTTDIINDSNKKQSHFDYFTNYYIQLDMYGFHKDKKFSNLIDDATHSFYGAYSDIFVTDDYNTYKKSTALYKKLNISTEVIYSDDFLSSFRRRKLYETAKPLLNQIVYLLKNSLLLIDTIDNELNPSRVYKVEPYLLNFFNRMQISEYETSNAIFFYKKQGNYSDFLFWTEIMEIINRISREFGLDKNNKEKFLEIERNEILEDKWTGRIWIFNNIEVIVYYEKPPAGLVLKFEIKKSRNR